LRRDILQPKEGILGPIGSGRRRLVALLVPTLVPMQLLAGIWMCVSE